MTVERVLVPLNRGFVAWISPEDRDTVMRLKWHVHQDTRRRQPMFYARSWLPKKQKHVLLHRFVMGETSCRIDHADRDGLNCTRGNLRLASYPENAANQMVRSKSGYKGVYVTCAINWEGFTGACGLFLERSNSWWGNMTPRTRDARNRPQTPL